MFCILLYIYSVTTRLQLPDNNQQSIQGTLLRKGQCQKPTSCLTRCTQGIRYALDHGLRTNYQCSGRNWTGMVFWSLIVFNSSPRWWYAWFGGILLFYRAIMMLIPVPGSGAGNLTMEGRLCSLSAIIPKSPAITPIMLNLDGSINHPFIYWKKVLLKHA